MGIRSLIQIGDEEKIEWHMWSLLAFICISIIVSAIVLHRRCDICPGLSHHNSVIDSNDWHWAFEQSVIIKSPTLFRHHCRPSTDPECLSIDKSSRPTLAEIVFPSWKSSFQCPATHSHNGITKRKFKFNKTYQIFCVNMIQKTV